MAIQVLSSQTGFNGSGTSITVGGSLGGVSLGQLLVVHYLYNDSSGTVTTPSGWTTASQIARGGSIGGRSNIFYKIADAGDVSSPSFTFSASSGSQARIAIMKIQAGRVSSPVTVTDGTQTAGSSTINAVSVTPTIANSMLLFFTVTGLSGYSVSGYSIPTSNPSSWTEEYDVQGNGSLAGFSMGYAIRPETTATGTPTATASSVTDSIGQIMVIAGGYTFTATETATATEIMSKYPKKVLLETAIVTDELDAEKQKWHNENKNISTWQNQIKND